MRSCDDMLEFISASLDGALSDAEAEALRDHLDHCAACRSLCEELSGIRQAMGELTAQAPEGFADAVLDRIRPESQTPEDKVVSLPAKKRRHWRGWAASAAVAALVVLGAVQLPQLLGPGGREPEARQAPSGAGGASSCADEAPQVGLEGAPQIEAEAGGDNSAAKCSPDGAPNEPRAEGVQDSLADADSPDGTSNSGLPEGTPAPMPALSAEPVYCGVLVLTGEPLPQGLAAFSSARNSVGELEYLVPAEYFFSNVAVLEETSATNFTVLDKQEDASVDPAAEYGLIIVQPQEGD